jgi:hypothetical protein
VLGEILEERVTSSRHRVNPRGVKRKMSNYRLRPRPCAVTQRIHFSSRIRIVKWTVLGLDLRQAKEGVYFLSTTRDQDQASYYYPLQVGR